MNEKTFRLLEEHKDWLVNFSSTNFKPSVIDRKYLYLVGIIEELVEYNTAKAIDKKKELGDALSYCLLSCHALGVHLSELETWNDEFDFLGLEEVIGEVAGFTKRLMRGDEMNLQKSIEVMTAVFVFILRKYDKFDEIISINRDKLEGRLKNKTLMGSGDNR